MRKSGLGDSPFFALPDTVEPPTTVEQGPKSASQPENIDVKDASVTATTAQTDVDTATGSPNDTMTPRYHDTTVETLRRAVKACGKEAATHRFTAAEKDAIAEIVYACKREGLRTTENEITRIAVNFIIAEYQAKGESSLLVKVLRALGA